MSGLDFPAGNNDQEDGMMQVEGEQPIQVEGQAMAIEEEYDNLFA